MEPKYIGMDVHTATTAIAVLNNMGKKVSEAIVETKGTAIRGFIKSHPGTLWVTFEEGTQAAWLYDLIQPHVAKVVVCDPRKITSDGNKADRPDAKRLAELLRTNALTPVYHGERSTRDLKELAKSYSALVEDTTRAKNRLKALFRARGLDCSGQAVYTAEDRQEWLRQLDGAGVRARARRLWEQIDCLRELGHEAGVEMVTEAKKDPATKILQTIPGIGQVRAAQVLAFVSTPHRFRSKRQFWRYVGLAVVTRASAEYEIAQGRLLRSRKRAAPRGLNRNCNRVLKNVFKGAAGSAARWDWKEYFDNAVKRGGNRSLVLLTMARKIAAITLAVWKKGESYDEKRLTMQVACVSSAD